VKLPPWPWPRCSHAASLSVSARRSRGMPVLVSFSRASCWTFLAAVRPNVANISVGEDNPYGHPSPELLARLERAGIRILRTDRDSAVEVLTDGEHIEINCVVDCTRASKAGLKKAQAPNHQQKSEHQQKTERGTILAISFVLR
jgi:hypothetical protein